MVRSVVYSLSCTLGASARSRELQATSGMPVVKHAGLSMTAMGPACHTTASPFVLTQHTPSLTSWPCLQVKGSTRRAFDQAQLSGAELVQLMHGMARMPRYAPNTGWLAAVARASQQHLQDLTPGEWGGAGTW